MRHMLALIMTLLTSLVHAETTFLGLNWTNKEAENQNWSTIDQCLGPITDCAGGVFDESEGYTITAPRFGARCDGVTDDRAAILRAVTAAADTKSPIRIPRGRCYVSDTIPITTDDIVIQGTGDASVLVFPSSVGSYLDATDVSGFQVKDLRIEGGGVGTGAFGACVQMRRVTDSTVENVTCYNPDDFGVYAIDSDRLTITNNRVLGADSRFVYGTQQPYCVLLDGTGGSTVSDNHCYQVLFGMLAQSANSSDTASGRAASLARGNTWIGNTVEYMYSHAFSLNGIDDQSVIGNVVKHYPLDGDSVRAAYQVKSTTPVGSVSDDRAQGNVFESNVAEDVDTCFGTNDGSRTQFNGGTCRDARYDGVWLNGTIRDQVNGLQVYGYNTLNGSRACVRVEASTQPSIRGVKCEADAAGTPTAVGIDVRSSSVNGWYDAIDLIGNFDTCISIGSGSNNTGFGAGIRLNTAGCTTPISDATTNSIFPRSFSVEFNAADSGFHFLARPPRGLIVGRVHYVVPAAISGGTPAIAVGQFGSNNKFITSTALSAVTAGTVNSYDATTSPALGSRDLTAGGYLQVNNTPNSASAGRIGVTVDGIDGPGPVTPTTTTTTTSTTTTT